MIVEAVVQVFMTIGQLIDTIIPDITWPDWILAPGNWLEETASTGFRGAADLTGAFAFIHPDVLSMLVLQFAIVSAIFVIRKVARLISLALGGGGVVSE